MARGILKMTGIALILLAVLVIAIGGLLSSSSAGKPAKGSDLFVQLTDPAQLPTGTQSVNISYSSIQLQLANGAGTEWLGSAANGTANLLGLVNRSKVIASFDVALNSTINKVRIYISRANITINGTEYPLAIPNGTILANVSNKALNGSESILLDLRPAILDVFSANSASFAMVPSVSSISLPSNATLAVNKTFAVGNTLLNKLQESIPNVSISDASVASQGNITSISFAVKDNSNASVTLTHLILYGNLSANLTLETLNVEQIPMVGNLNVSGFINSTSSAISNAISSLNKNITIKLPNLTSLNTSVLNVGNSISNDINNVKSFFNFSSVNSIGPSLGGIANGTLNGAGKLGSSLNISDHENLLTGIIANMTNSTYANSLKGKNLSYIQGQFNSIVSNANLSHANITNIEGLISKATAEAKTFQVQSIKSQQMQLQLIGFLFEGNSSLALPSNVSQIVYGKYGYTLQPGQSERFTFSNRLEIADGEVLVKLLSGNDYKLEVIGSNGAFAQVNVTAG